MTLSLDTPPRLQVVIPPEQMIRDRLIQACDEVRTLRRLLRLSRQAGSGQILFPTNTTTQPAPTHASR